MEPGTPASEVPSIAVCSGGTAPPPIPTANTTSPHSGAPTAFGFQGWNLSLVFYPVTIGCFGGMVAES